MRNTFWTQLIRSGFKTSPRAQSRCRAEMFNTQNMPFMDVYPAGFWRGKF
jgi:hypothetical protein